MKMKYDINNNINNNVWIKYILKRKIKIKGIIIKVKVKKLKPIK